MRNPLRSEAEAYRFLGVVIVGAGLDGPDLTVTFSGAPATILFRSPALLEAVVPPAAISGMCGQSRLRIARRSRCRRFRCP